MALPQEIIDLIETLVTEKFNELIAANKLDVTADATEINQFAEQMMIKHDGDEVITQGFFRTFLDWLSKYYTYNLSLEENTVLAACRYITPVDLAGTPDVGKIIAPVASLILTGAGVEPTIPADPDITPDDAGFDPSTHILKGQFAYNITDNEWFYRGASQIYSLKESLSLLVADITDFDSAMSTLLAGYVEVVAGKGLSANDFTDALKLAYDGVVAAYGLHEADTTIHTPPDETTIKTVGGELVVDAEAVKGLLSGTAPIVKTDGAFSLGINTDQFEIVDNKLQIKAGVLGGGDPILLSFDSGTGILSIGTTGTETVDLSSLEGGSVDLSNYVKKTGESSQTIAGNLNVTGEMEAYASS